MTEKTIDDYFCDWQSYAFGFGYGSGEMYILPKLKQFLALCNEGDGNRAYTHTKIENVITPAVAWLLINVLCRANIIDYGCSPRYAWLTKTGERLKEYCGKHTSDELIKICGNRDEGYISCSPDYCNCGEEGYEEGQVCQNPFWLDLPVAKQEEIL
jgi:hypothetical protein